MGKGSNFSYFHKKKSSLFLSLKGGLLFYKIKI
jgi:hypothetical protein